MGLQRAGWSLFGFGLFVGSVAAVTGGLVSGRTDVGCPADFEPRYGVERVAFETVSALQGTPLAGLSLPELYLTDGCNVFTVGGVVQAALLFMLLGLLVGTLGVLLGRA
ncbi:hypothetical protein [Halomarina ordinaria]|uniref:Uncharacterized protein n=1 Tax=Halomarina ordinaria TaxID=3033939 RepID=A0ABD5U5Q4_9EURY|nr:hypothetical protein [Halomarina sp. PSRA2]